MTVDVSITHSDSSEWNRFGVRIAKRIKKGKSNGQRTVSAFPTRRNVEKCCNSFWTDKRKVKTSQLNRPEIEKISSQTFGLGKSVLFRKWWGGRKRGARIVHRRQQTVSHEHAHHADNHSCTLLQGKNNQWINYFVLPLGHSFRNVPETIHGHRKTDERGEASNVVSRTAGVLSYRNDSKVVQRLQVQKQTIGGGRNQNSTTNIRKVFVFFEGRKMFIPHIDSPLP